MIRTIFYTIFIVFTVILTYIVTFNYDGNIYIYILFSFVSMVLFLFAFRKNSIFFDTFIGVFLWIGFYLKITIEIIYPNSMYLEGIKDNLSLSTHIIDESLIVSSLSFLAIIIGSFIREKLFFNYPKKLKESTDNFYF